MKTRKNVEVRVSVDVVEVVGYPSNVTLAKAERTQGGEMDTKTISATIKALVMEARTSALDGIDAVATKDEVDEAKDGQK